MHSQNQKGKKIPSYKLKSLEACEGTPLMSHPESVKHGKGWGGGPQTLFMKS